ILLEVNNHPLGRGAEEGEAGDLELAQAIAEGAAAVGFLDAAGQRALAADASAVGIGETGAGKGAGREDERILRRERIDRGQAALDERLGDEIAARQYDLLAVQFVAFDRVRAEANDVIGANGISLCFRGGVTHRRPYPTHFVPTGRSHSLPCAL